MKETDWKERFRKAWESGGFAPKHHKFVEHEAVKEFISRELKREREEMGRELKKTIKTFEWTSAHNSMAHNQQLKDIIEIIDNYLERRK